MSTRCLSGVLDKHGLLENAATLVDAIVEVGCGALKRYPASLGIDCIDSPAVDVVGDALEVLRRLPDGMARLVTSSHFLEHVADPLPLLDEMARLLAPGGEIEIVVPHFSNPYWHSDPTHAASVGFGLYTMSYLARDERFRRKVPGYARREHLTLRQVDLRFKAARPFYGRYAIKRVLGAAFNSCRYMQELWEESFCYLLPCYEIRYLLGHTADGGRAS